MQAQSNSWKAALDAALTRPVWVMLLLGFSAGIPILLIFSSLSIWLREADVSRSAITFFSWAALGYSFKFVWAPLVDQLPLPVLTRVLGRRRSWLLLSQLAVVGAIFAMGSVDPASGESALTAMALAAVALGFSSATQDIVIDAYRIEAADKRIQGMLSSTYIGGYRLAMLVSGAGALYLAAYFGSSGEAYDYSAWQKTYWLMAAAMSVGIVTTLCISEPEGSQARHEYSSGDYLRFLLLFALVVLSFIFAYSQLSAGLAYLKAAFDTVMSGPFMGFVAEVSRLLLALAAAAVAATLLVKANIANREMVKGTYVAPVQDFFNRFGIKTALVLLLLVCTYRVSDIVLGVMSNVFYLDMGYEKTDIAAAVKTFGLFMTLLGGFGGGILAMRFGVVNMLLVGGILAAGTNLLFIWLTLAEPSFVALYTVVAADNLSAGLASAAFIAYLASLTNIQFTAVQYAIFSSIMTLFPKVLGGYSGTIVDSLGYVGFFIMTTLLGLPVLLLILYARRYVDE
ncbi:MAG: AmpG family muropeptide MFS transporter [Pontibacterium sp.]